jgi:hypothetical protein
VNLNPTFCIYPSFRKKADFAGFYCAVRRHRCLRARAKEKAKARAAKKLHARALLPAYYGGLFSGLEAD